MEKIASFNVNHLDLLPGIYVSRKDSIGQEMITTFDLRFTRPNVEPVMSTAAIHTIEHLGATFLRNHPLWKDRTIYLGQWGAEPGSMFSFQVILHPKIFWMSFTKCADLFWIFPEIFPVLLPETAEIILI